jgi:proteasome lid subunit RPN8/RPN11
LETFLSENAFVSMVTAAVETYPQETLGVLIGLRGPRAIWVQYAIAYQTAERAKMEVTAHPIRTRRTNRFLEKITHLELVGDFHSHTKVPIDKASSIQPSQTDKESMSQKNLGIIIAINKDKVQRNWRHLPKGSLKGGVFPYSLKIASWFKSGRDQYEISRIECPFALGLGL